MGRRLRGGGGKILQRWIPDIPLWVIALVFMLLMTATNLYPVASYGEFEYSGSLFVLGLWPGRDMDFSGLTAYRGFLPNGVTALFSGIVIVVFGMVGAEVATIAVAEPADPRKAVAKATNSVIFRVAFFYVVGIFLLVNILPWNSPGLGSSPFVSALEVTGIPRGRGDHERRSSWWPCCPASRLYTASRMLFVLAGRQEAPRQLLDLTRRGVPMKAILRRPRPARLGPHPAPPSQRSRRSAKTSSRRRGRPARRSPRPPESAATLGKHGLYLADRRSSIRLA